VTMERRLMNEAMKEIARSVWEQAKSRSSRSIPAGSNCRQYTHELLFFGTSASTISENNQKRRLTFFMNFLHDGVQFFERVSILGK
jgi:hypothetical protein